MNACKISVVIPTYNGKDHLGEAVQSVLEQTYSNFEIVVVDDASPQDVSDVVNSFTDPRVRYIRHAKNKGAVAARKTGVHASTGEIIAFLDQDDLFHKRKLEAHLDYFLKNPEIGLTYNDRFEVLGTEKTLCGIHRPPATLKLADWVLGFPISPSDAVLKREWAVRDEIWDDSFASQAEHVIFNGQEIIFGGRLALAGCKFGNVGRALNYRRYHPFRIQKYLSERCQAELACQEIVFSDARCPYEIRALRSLASANLYVIWAYTAYMQEEYDLGKNFLKQALRLQPSFFMDGDPCQFLNSWIFWISAGTVDYARRHDVILRSVFENLPQELQHLRSKYDWAIARSYLLKGLHSMIWSKKHEAEVDLRTSIQMGAKIDAEALNMLSDELLNYESELGGAMDRKVIDSLSQLLRQLDKRDSARFLVGFYAINKAFRNYHKREYQSVPGNVLQALKADPRYLLNKGALSVLLRSLFWRIKLAGDQPRGS